MSDVAAEADVVTLLEAVRRSVADLLGSTPGPPRSVRVQAHGVCIEVAFPDAGAVVAAPGLGANGKANGEANGYADGVAEPADRAHPVDRPLICAPIVGVFYVAPSPGAPPFVAVGDDVLPGQQVGIVEAMKTMIPVEAPVAGRVVEVLVADGHPVEYGEPLIVLEELSHADGPDRQPR